MKLNLSSASIQDAFTSSKKKPKSMAGVAGVAVVEGDEDDDED